MFIVVIIAVSLIVFEAGFKAGYYSKEKDKRKKVIPENTAQTEEYHNFITYNGDTQQRKEKL